MQALLYANVKLIKFELFGAFEYHPTYMTEYNSQNAGITDCYHTKSINPIPSYQELKFNSRHSSSS